MTTISINIPLELKKEMDEFDGINWSEVARLAIHLKIADLKFMKTLIADSEITSEDAERIGREITANIYDRYSRD